MDFFSREECPPVNYLTKVGTLIKTCLVLELSNVKTTSGLLL